MSEPDELPIAPLPRRGDPTGEVFVAADDAEHVPGPTEVQPAASALRTATMVSGRIVLGITTIALIGIVVAAAVLLPLPSMRIGAISTVVTPVPTAEQLVCPGGLLRIGSTSGADATKTFAIGAPRVVSVAEPSVVTQQAFAASDSATGNSSAAPQLLSTAPAETGTQAARVAGAQSESINTDEFVGLSSAACVAATGSSWLTGGATSVGRTTLLLLANPTKVSSTVSLEVFGETGKVTAPGMDGIIVPPDSQRVLSLAGFAPNLTSPVVHVTSTGGLVAATLEQSTVRGLLPGGIDFVGAEPQPLTTTVIPGVVVSGSATIQSQLGQSGFDDLQTTLRLFVPDGSGDTVTIAVLAEDGTVSGKPITAVVNAGSVTDVPLDSLSDGNYTVVVTSKRPIVASVRVSTAGSPEVNGSTDFDWVTAASVLTSNVLVSVATGMQPELHLDNPGDTAETVRVRARTGASLDITVKPHSATVMPVIAGRSYELSGFTRLYASVSGTSDGGVTSYLVSPTAHGDGPLRVYG